MNYNIKSTLILACCGLLTALKLPVCAQSNPAAPQSQLRAWLETPKQEYKFCERIPAFMFVVNEGAATVSVPYVDDWCVAMPNKFQMRLIDTSGVVERTEFECHETYPNDSISLAPGDTVMFAFELVSIYGRGGRYAQYPPSVPTGEYSIDATYMGTITVQSQKFSIIGLTTDEEAQIAVFTAVWNSQLKGKDRFQAYVDAYDRLKQSPFGALACELINLQPASYETNRDRRVHFALEYLLHFPSERSTDLAFGVLIKYSKRNKALSALKALPELRTNRFLRNMFKNGCRRRKDMALYHEVMK